MHGRTVEQRTCPVNYDAIKLIKEHVHIPVIANGDICSLKDVQEIHERTNADGKVHIHVM